MTTERTTPTAKREVELSYDDLELIETALRFLLTSSKREEHVFSRIQALMEVIHHELREPPEQKAA